MSLLTARITRWSFVATAAALALSVFATGPAVEAQGAGRVVFTSRRVSRDFTGNLSAWAASNRAAAFEEDTQSHVWRVNMVIILPRPPSTHDVTLSWFHIEGRARRYINNIEISLTQPTPRIFSYSATLIRHPDHFQPMETYEAVVAQEDRSGQRPLARGRILLRGQVERRGPGVIDFTQPSDGGT